MFKKHFFFRLKMSNASFQMMSSPKKSLEEEQIMENISKWRYVLYPPLLTSTEFEKLNF